jgi:uncharacterized YkwD family protein
MLCSFLLLTVGSPNQASAASGISVLVDERSVVFPDVKPLIKEGRILVPIRPIFEAMGANVQWNSQTRTVHSALEKNKQTMELQLKIDSPYAFRDFNGIILRNQGSALREELFIQKMDVVAQVINGRTMIPLRATGESFGYTVGWNSQLRKGSLGFSGSLELQSPTFTEYRVEGEISQMHDYELDTFFFTNEKRAANGLKPFILHIKLSQVARDKSKDMLDKQYFNHDSPTYGSPFKMMKDYGIHYSYAGENIAAGHPTPVNVVNGWMDSPGHRANILNKSFTHIGIGYIKGNQGYGTYWAQMFLAK